MHQAVQSTVNDFLASADATLPKGYSAVLYGSAARGDYVAGRSDVNLLVVADSADFPVLRALGSALRTWSKASREPPLLFTRSEWADSTDAFPIEITDMRSHYEVVRGSDPVAPMQVSRAELRQALESELRGKLMRLRQAYATFGNDAGKLTPVARSSVSSILVLLRALVGLERGEGAASDDSERLVGEAARISEFAPDALLALVRHRDQKSWSCGADLFEGYVTSVARAAHHVDQLQTGDS